MICRREAGTGVRPSIIIEQLRGSEEEPLKLQLESFLAAVASGHRPVVSGEDGRAALDLAHQVLEAIERFLRRNQNDAAASTSA
jgi:predicted dehydrogenase